MVLCPVQTELAGLQAEVQVLTGQLRDAQNQATAQASLTQAQQAL